MKDWNEITPFRVLLVMLLITLIIVLLPGCSSTYYVSQDNKQHTCELLERGDACLSDHSCCKEDNTLSYWKINYVPTIGLYYYNDLPYWGYYGGYYYYYGYRHIYPWWFYYNTTPSYYYNVNTHVHCHIGNGGYVYRPRGNWRHNNKTNLTYHHDKIHTTGINVKDKSNTPIKWRNNTVKINNNTRVKTNKNTIINNPIITPPIKNNIKNNNKSNINRSNTNKTNKTNRINRSNIKVNTNKSNTNRSNKNRSIKTNSRKPR